MASADRLLGFLLLLGAALVAGQDDSYDDDGDDGVVDQEETCSWFRTITGQCHKPTFDIKIVRKHPDDLKVRHRELHQHHHRHHHHKELPAVEDLRPKMPPVYNQGQLGSCTANALIAALQYDVPTHMGSRLFLYYQERVIEKDVSEDKGAFLEDGVKVLEKYGVCPESVWPYVEHRFAERPPENCYKMAGTHHVVEAHNVHPTLEGMKKCLASGFPFVVAIMIYPSFQTFQVSRTGMVPMPSPGEEAHGGHAVLCVGYNDHTRKWIMRNSWGPNWGDKGYFYLDYEYLLDHNLATDMWTLTKAT